MLFCLELLETDNFRLLPFQPTQEVCKPLIDVVDVEGCNLHATSSAEVKRRSRKSRGLLIEKSSISRHA
jgi:hypothetical protein